MGQTHAFDLGGKSARVPENHRCPQLSAVGDWIKTGIIVSCDQAVRSELEICRNEKSALLVSGHHHTSAGMDIGGAILWRVSCCVVSAFPSSFCHLRRMVHSSISSIALLHPKPFSRLSSRHPRRTRYSDMTKSCNRDTEVANDERRHLQLVSCCSLEQTAPASPHTESLNTALLLLVPETQVPHVAAFSTSLGAAPSFADMIGT